MRAVLSDAEALLRYVERAHREALPSCLTTLGMDPQHMTAPRAREPCGVLSEELWLQSEAPVVAFLRAAGGAAAPEETDRVMFADVDCRGMSERELGAALHLAARAPRWTAHRFLECVVRRELGTEGFALWTALDAAVLDREAIRWAFLRDAPAGQDPRTQLRVQRVLAGELGNRNLEQRQ